MTVDWTARLDGDDCSLQELASRFTQGWHRVKQEQDGRYYLTSPDLIACRTDGEAWMVAERILKNINSVARVVDPDFKPVCWDVLNRLERDGTRRCFLRVRGTDLVEVAGSWMTATVAERLIELLEREGAGSAVSRSLEQWELPEQTPTSLNNILEIIRDDVSGGDPDRGRAWDTMAQTLAPAIGKSAQQLDDELRRCRDSLHDPSAVGPLARHGSSRPVANPMYLDEARDFVHRLLLAWLRGKV